VKAPQNSLLFDWSTFSSVQSTEYTQSGYGRYLAYIPSWWKNQHWLVRVGGERPHPHPLTQLTNTDKVADSQSKSKFLCFCKLPWFCKVLAWNSLCLASFPHWEISIWKAGFCAYFSQLCVLNIFVILYLFALNYYYHIGFILDYLTWIIRIAYLNLHRVMCLGYLKYSDM
jgi:hypothetical protein